MAETLLLQQTFESSISALARRLMTERPSGPVELWLFEGEAVRRSLVQELAAQGIEATARSACKPLVHHFLEAADLAGVSRVTVRYPVHPIGHPARFRLEAYPLAALLAGITLDFEARPVQADAAPAMLAYEVILHRGTRTEALQVLAPNQLVADFLGQQVLRPTALLLRREHGRALPTVLECEYLQCHDAVMQAIVQHPWGRKEPYFDTLRIEARLPGIERPLPVGHESISTTEALHEDLYFSLLEFFQHHSGRPAGNRGLQPGQIIPDIRLSQGEAAQVRVTMAPATPLAEPAPIAPPRPQAGEDVLAALPVQGAPLPIAQAHAALAQLGGEPFAFASRQGRAVVGMRHRGNRPAVLISGAQHANETTGVVGALRAADALRHEVGAHFVLMPLENPDGYALHEALRAHNPRHMLHAARYSALGDDIEYRERAPWYERRARQHAFAASGAQLHLNLHGYPAHEWTRPCTGYLPRGFELWSLPKGFFLILRYHAPWQTQAMALLEHVTLELARNAELMALNQRQIDICRQHTGTLPFELMNGVPFMASPVEGGDCEVTLITEFPDETIEGDAFVLGHTAQMQTVLAATRWWWARA